MRLDRRRIESAQYRDPRVRTQDRGTLWRRRCAGRSGREPNRADSELAVGRRAGLSTPTAPASGHLDVLSVRGKGSAHELELCFRDPQRNQPAIVRGEELTETRSAAPRKGVLPDTGQPSGYRRLLSSRLRGDERRTADRCHVKQEAACRERRRPSEPRPGYREVHAHPSVRGSSPCKIAHHPIIGAQYRLGGPGSGNPEQDPTQGHYAVSRGMIPSLRDPSGRTDGASPVRGAGHYPAEREGSRESRFA